MERVTTLRWHFGLSFAFFLVALSQHVLLKSAATSVINEPEGFQEYQERPNLNRDLRRSWNPDLEFVTRTVVQDIDTEIRVAYQGRIGMETMLPRMGEYTLFLREITDGKKIIQLIYKDRTTLYDCEISREQVDIEKFLGKVLGVDRQLMELSGFTQFSRTDVRRMLRRLRGNTTVDFLDGATLEEQFLPIVDFVGSKGECRHFHHVLKKWLDMRKANPEQVIEFSEFLEHNTHRSLSGTSRRRSKRAMFQVIYPGTKWCGNGNSAAGFEDLGENMFTDKCCRKHDYCPKTIESFTTKYNMFNYRFHTISHCKCDQRFQRCLKRASTEASNWIGSIFFNIMSTKCFDFKKEQKCVRRSWWGTCVKYRKRRTAYIKDASTY